MSKFYEIVIYTASSSKYAIPVIDKLDPLGLITHRLFRNHCKLISNEFVKDLSVIGRDLSQIIIIDNSPISYKLQPDNAIPIKSWTGDQSDKELEFLMPLLEKVSTLSDVRGHLKKKYHRPLSNETFSTLFILEKNKKDALGQKSKIPGTSRYMNKRKSYYPSTTKSCATPHSIAIMTKYSDIADIPKEKCSLKHRLISINTNIQLSKKCLLTDDIDNNTTIATNIVQHLLKRPTTIIHVTKIKRSEEHTSEL